MQFATSLERSSHFAFAKEIEQHLGQPAKLRNVVVGADKELARARHEALPGPAAPGLILDVGLAGAGPAGVHQPIARVEGLLCAFSEQGNVGAQELLVVADGREKLEI